MTFNIRRIVLHCMVYGVLFPILSGFIILLWDYYFRDTSAVIPLGLRLFSIFLEIVVIGEICYIILLILWRYVFPPFLRRFPLNIFSFYLLKKLLYDASLRCSTFLGMIWGLDILVFVGFPFSDVNPFFSLYQLFFALIGALIFGGLCGRIIHPLWREDIPKMKEPWDASIWDTEIKPE